MRLFEGFQQFVLRRRVHFIGRKNEIELIQGIDRSIDKKVELPSEIDFKNKILPNLKNETHRNKSNLLLVEKHTNIFFNKLGGNFYLLKNKRIFQAEKARSRPF